MALFGLLAGLSIWPFHCALAQTAEGDAGIVRLSEVNSLDGPEMKPWHLKVAFSVFDEAGKPDGDGVAEEWWAGTDRLRLEITEDGHKSVTVRVPEGTFHSADAAPVSQDVQLMLAQVVHPVSHDDMVGATPETREQEFGKLKLQCTMMDQPLKGEAKIPLGLFATYCTEGDKLRLTWLSTNINVIANQTGTFQGHEVPVKIEVAASRKKHLEAHVEQLGTISADEIDLSTAEMKRVPPGVVRVSGGVMQGNKIGGPAPKYPENARRNRADGSVVMVVIIGTDGRVHSPRVVSSPDPELSVAALIAVEQWVYRPYELNGVPTEVTTTITVNFNLRHV